MRTALATVAPDAPLAANDNAPRGLGRGPLVVPRNDHLGTTQVMSDASGQAVWSASYEPFRLEGDWRNGVDNRLRFPGQYDDGTAGIGRGYWNYHRYYDPAIGRYTQPDPQVVSLDGNGAGVREYSFEHPYAYAWSDPLTHVDPLGLDGSTTMPWWYFAPVAAPWVAPVCLAGAVVLTFGATFSGDTPMCQDKCKPKTPPMPPPPPKRPSNCYVRCFKGAQLVKSYTFAVSSVQECWEKGKVMDISLSMAGTADRCVPMMSVP